MNRENEKKNHMPVLYNDNMIVICSNLFEGACYYFDKEHVANGMYTTMLNPIINNTHAKETEDSPELRHCNPKMKVLN